MTKKVYIIIIWIVFFSGFVFTPKSFAAPLKFIKGFKVTIEEEFIPDTIIKSGLDISKLKAIFEEKLKNAGIKVYSSDPTEYYKSGRPYLNLEITGAIDSDKIFFVSDLEIIQTVRLWEYPDETARASFGISRYVGKYSDINELYNLLEKQIENFITNYIKSR